MASLADMRARLAAQNSSQQKQTARSSSDKAVYPFWNMDINQSAVLRFLPDADVNNPWFWVERQIISLPFAGVKGNPELRRVQVKVPCIEMYGSEYAMKCPVHMELRAWYKSGDDNLKTEASKYWKKRSFLFQGFVRSNPLANDETPENPIRRFVISTQILPIIQAGIVDPEMLELPTHYEKGLDFYVRKTAKPGGKYAEYTTSGFARRESPLTEVERAAIQTFGLYNLTDFLPKKPSDAELRVIKEMFDASTQGLDYDPDKWGGYYRPYGVKAPEGAHNTQNVDDSDEPSAPAVTKRAPVVTEDNDDPPFEVAKVQPAVTRTPSTDKATEILAIIKARQNKG